MEKTSRILLEYDTLKDRWPVPILDHYYVSLLELRKKDESGKWQKVNESDFTIEKDTCTFISWANSQEPIPNNLYAIISTKKIMDNRLIGSLVGAFAAVLVALLGLIFKNDAPKTNDGPKYVAQIKVLENRCKSLEYDSIQVRKEHSGEIALLITNWQDSIKRVNEYWLCKDAQSNHEDFNSYISDLNEEIINCEKEISTIIKKSGMEELDEVSRKSQAIQLEYLLGKMYTLNNELDAFVSRNRLKMKYPKLFLLTELEEEDFNSEHWTQFKYFFMASRRTTKEIRKLFDDYRLPNGETEDKVFGKASL